MRVALPDLKQAGGLADLLVVVRVVFSGGQLEEGLGDKLALAVAGSAHGFVQLKYGVSYVYVGVKALCFRLHLVIVNRP